MTNTQLDAEKLWQIAWTYIQTVVNTAREPFVILDKNLRVISANKTFYTFFEVLESDTEGQLVYSLGDGQWDIPKLRILLEDILPKNSFFEGFRVEHDFPHIGHRTLSLNGRRIYTHEATEPIILVAMEDIGQQVQLEIKVKAYAKELTREVAIRTAELEVRVKELERLNTIMLDRELRMIELKAELKQLKKRQ